MFTINKTNSRKRYSGVDLSPWKVVSYSSEELGRKETVRDANGKNPRSVYVTRWNGFKTANAAAKALGGVAVRA